MPAPPVMDGNTFAALLQLVYAAIGASFAFTTMLGGVFFVLYRAETTARAEFHETYQRDRYAFLEEWIPVRDSLRERRRVVVDRLTEDLAGVTNPISPETAQDLMELHDVGLDEFGQARVLSLIRRLNRDMDAKQANDAERGKITSLLGYLHEFLTEHESRQQVTGTFAAQFGQQ